MKNKHFMKEYRHFDGDHSITFNLLEVNTDNNTVTVAISNQGKITQETFVLQKLNNRFYFEYGIFGENKIFVDEFEQVEEE